MKDEKQPKKEVDIKAGTKGFRTPAGFKSQKTDKFKTSQRPKFNPNQNNFRRKNLG